ncbi:related to NADH-cytochrome b5 reductase 2-B [Zygosaccharomyces bailii]|nr:related to NADH-cytochrome b5 reductase 2-B [Zygosaccharomyces bailii]
MSILLTNKWRFIIPASLGTSLGLYISTRFLSCANYNDTAKALKGFGKWQSFRITKIEQLTPNTKKFTFELPSDKSILGIKPVSFVLANVSRTWGPWNIRPYTPVSRIDDRGNFELIVKHIPGGKVSGQFFRLKANDSVSFMGPMLKYNWKPNTFEEVNLLCGGTGITPMFQLTRHILENPSDRTNVRLFYANKTEDDILLRRELEDLKKEFPDRFLVHYYVEEGPIGSGIKRGRILKEDIKGSANSNKAMFFLCGTNGFIDTYAGPKGIFGLQYTVGGILGNLGYKPSQVFRF